jgi:hypothetical protein
MKAYVRRIVVGDIIWPWKQCCAALNIVDSEVMSTVHTQNHYVPMQQWLRERWTVLRYSTLPNLLKHKEKETRKTNDTDERSAVKGKWNEVAPPPSSMPTHLQVYRWTEKWNGCCSNVVSVPLLTYIM